jgi:hypothetical protein
MVAMRILVPWLSGSENANADLLKSWHQGRLNLLELQFDFRSLQPHLVP